MKLSPELAIIRDPELFSASNWRERIPVWPAWLSIRDEEDEREDLYTRIDDQIWNLEAECEDEILPSLILYLVTTVFDEHEELELDPDEPYPVQIESIMRRFPEYLMERAL